MMKKGFLIEKIKPIDLKDIQGLTYEIFKEEIAQIPDCP